MPSLSAFSIYFFTDTHIRAYGIPTLSSLTPMDLAKKLSFLVILVCVLIALNNQRAAPRSRSALEGDEPSAARRNLGGDESPSPQSEGRRLTYDFYRTSCPSAEEIVRTTMRELHGVKSSVGPALLRLSFHDCFIMGCDASVLLDSEGDMKSEKEAIPNLSLRGFEEMDIIKSKVEEECAGVVSCADILALAARESVLLAGGQFYPVFTGRLDSRIAFRDNATEELPGPDFEVKRAVEFFAAKGFDAREMIALLGGGHSTGKIHCNFIHDRIFKFDEKNGASDPTINSEFLETLKSECSHPASTPSQSPSPSSPEKVLFENRAMPMDYEGAGNGFGEVYFRSLLQGKGLLFADQQLTSLEDTKAWVKTYASDLPQFRRDFGLAMFKLTHLPGSNHGEVRLNCRRVNKVV